MSKRATDDLLKAHEIWSVRRSTKGIGKHDNGVEGYLHGLGDTFGLADLRHPGFLNAFEVNVGYQPCWADQGDIRAGRSRDSLLFTCCSWRRLRIRGRFTTIPAVQHPVPDTRHFDNRGESLGTFEALDVVEVGGLLKVDVPQGRLNGHHHLAGFDVEGNTAGVCLLHKTPVLTDRALSGVATQKANTALGQHPLDQGDTVLEGRQDDGQVPVAPVIQAAVEARGREALYILDAMVAVRKQMSAPGGR